MKLQAISFYPQDEAPTRLKLLVRHTWTRVHLRTLHIDLTSKRNNH